MRFTLIITTLLALSGCKNPNPASNSPKIRNEIACNNNRCEGTYKGKEFINGSDIAHQFSNKMSAAVGDKLKQLYTEHKLSLIHI